MSLNAPNDDISISLADSTKNMALHKTPSRFKLAFHDFKESFVKWRVWLLFAYQDIQLRYRRSILGPFWITLSMGITVYAMGYLYAQLFRQNIAQYYPYLVGGMLSWALISTVIAEVTDGLIHAESFIKNIKLPYILHIQRIASRNILIFFHNILVMIPIWIIFHETAKVNLNSLLLIPGLLIIYINTLTFGLMIAMIGARFRDISQVIKSLLQVIFFVTPVLWSPNVLSVKTHFIVDWNPLYALIEIIRQPLLGMAPSGRCIVFALALTILGVIISAIFFSKYRSRIIYWL